MLKRDVKPVFITQPYRVVLKKRSTGQLVHKLQELSAEYGNYFRLHKKKNEQVEVEISEEAGYSLGHHVRDFFKQYHNLIFIEPFEDSYFLLVVVDKHIVVDRRIRLDDMKMVLRPFWLEGDHFHVILAQNIDVSPKEMGFDAKHLDLERLNSPVISELLLEPKYRFYKLDKAVSVAKLGYQKRSLIIGIVIAAIIVVPLIFYLTKPQQLVRRNVVDPLKHYERALMTPAPHAIIKQVAGQFDSTYHIAGWFPHRVTWKAGRTTIELHQLAGGSYRILTSWVQKNKVQMRFKNDKAFVMFRTHAETRPKPKYIMPLQKVIFSFMDKVQSAFHEVGVKEESTTHHSHYQSATMVVTVNGVSAAILKSIIEAFAHYPAELQSLSFSVNEGLLSGSIRLRLLGH